MAAQLQHEQACDRILHPISFSRQRLGGFGADAAADTQPEPKSVISRLGLWAKRVSEPAIACSNPGQKATQL